MKTPPPYISVLLYHPHPHPPISVHLHESPAVLPSRPYLPQAQFLFTNMKTPPSHIVFCCLAVNATPPLSFSFYLHERPAPPFFSAVSSVVSELMSKDETRVRPPGGARWFHTVPLKVSTRLLVEAGHVRDYW